MSGKPNRNIVLDEALKDAVMRDEPDAAREALAAGADANGWMPVHQHLLLGAAANGSPEVIGLLLEYGANPLATDRDGKNAYHKLAEGMPLDDARRAQAIRRLKRVGPDPDDPVTKWSDTALHKAAANDLPEICRALVVDCGADVNAVDASGETPAHTAVAANREAALYELLLLGADIECTDARGLTISTLADEEANGAVKSILHRYISLPVPDVTQDALMKAVRDTAQQPPLLHNPKFWQQAEQALGTLERQGTPLDIDMLCDRPGKEGGAPIHMAWRCGKLDAVLAHVQRHHGPITAAHLRDDEGKPTALCRLLTEAEAAGAICREAYWRGQAPETLKDTYMALPEAARQHVPNYRQLLCRAEMEQRQLQRGR